MRSPGWTRSRNRSNDLPVGPRLGRKRADLVHTVGGRGLGSPRCDLDPWTRVHGGAHEGSFTHDDRHGDVVTRTDAFRLLGEVLSHRDRRLFAT